VSTDRASTLLGEGVFRIILGTLAFTHEAGVKQLVATYGEDRVMIALDYAEGKVMVRGWTEATGIPVVHALNSFKKLVCHNTDTLLFCFYDLPLITGSVILLVSGVPVTLT